MNIGYFVPLYPSISLTFIAREIKALEELGCTVTVFAFEPADQDFLHPEFLEIKARVIYPPRLRSWRILEILWVHLFVAFTNPKGYVRALKESKNIPARQLFMKVGSFLQIGYFAYLVRKSDIHRLHAHFAHTWAVTAVLTSWMANTPFSLTTHAADNFANLTPEILPLLFSAADFVVTISEYNRKYLLNTFSDVLQPEQVFVVHCGIDLKCFGFIPYHRKAEGKLSIVTVARLTEKKGHRVLIEALEYLKRQGIEFEWIVVGRGDEFLAYLERLVADKDLTDKVKFVGPAVRDEVQRILRETDVMVLPCIQSATGDVDGIPVALMEAMAMGVPVVSTNISGIPELISSGENGFLVSPNNSAELAQVLHQIFEDQVDCRKIALRAREKIEADFNIETEASWLLDIFRQANSQKM